MCVVWSSCSQKMPFCGSSFWTFGFHVSLSCMFYFSLTNAACICFSGFVHYLCSLGKAWKRKKMTVWPLNVRHKFYHQIFSSCTSLAVYLNDRQELRSTQPLLTFHFSFLAFTKQLSAEKKVEPAQQNQSSAAHRLLGENVFRNCSKNLKYVTRRPPSVFRLRTDAPLSSSVQHSHY